MYCKSGLRKCNKKKNATKYTRKIRVAAIERAAKYYTTGNERIDPSSTVKVENYPSNENKHSTSILQVHKW